MYKPINGYTKALMIKAIREGNTGRKSITEDGRRCSYRGAMGNKCAVGVFIPDEECVTDPDDLSLSTIAEIYADYMPIEVDALEDLQRTHDMGGSEDPRPRLIQWINENVED